MATIVLTGGGTAGHVWPHFALFDDPASPLKLALDEGRLKVVYFGSTSGMERRLVTEAMGREWTYVPLSSGKLRRFFSWRNFSDPFRVLLGFWQAFRTLGRHRVAVVFSKGGYVAAPVVWAAWLRGVPVVIHESDVTPALATKLSLPFAKTILCSFGATREMLPAFAQAKTEAMGLPLRPSLFGASKSEAMRYFGWETAEPALPVLLVFGGSLGAEIINKTVKEALPKLVERFRVIHIVGRDKGFQEDLPEDMRTRYFQAEFLGSEMKLAYAAADLALSRAGASSIFELAAARIPMLVVPLDLNQSRGDQIINARVFSEKGWAKVLREAEFSPSSLVDKLTEMSSEAALESARQNLATAPGPDSAKEVATLLAGTIWSR